MSWGKLYDWEERAQDRQCCSVRLGSVHNARVVHPRVLGNLLRVLTIIS